MRLSSISAVVGLLATTVACSSGGSSPAPSTGTPSGLASTPAAHPPAVRKVRVAHPAPLPHGTAVIRLHGVNGATAGPSELAIGLGAVWASTGIFKIDPSTNVASKPLSARVSSTDTIGVGAGAVWAVDSLHGVLLRYDAHGRLTATDPLPDGLPEDVVASPTSVWVALHHGGGVAQIDASSGKTLRTVSFVPTGAGGPQGETYADGSVWVDAPNGPGVYRIDPRSAKVAGQTTFADGLDPCGGVAVTPVDVWVSQCLDGPHLYRIDRRSNALAAVYDVGGLVTSLAVDGQTVWFVASGDPDSSPNAPSYLIQLNRTGAIVRSFALPRGFTTGGLAIGFGSLWLSSVRLPEVLRVPR